MLYNQAAAQMLVSAAPKVKCRVLARHAIHKELTGQEVLKSVVQQA